MMTDKNNEHKLEIDDKNNPQNNNGDAQQNDDKKSQGSGIALWLPIGMCLGCSFGLLLDNIGMGMSLGMLWGVAIGLITDSHRKKKQEGGNDEKELQEVTQDKITAAKVIQETAKSEQDNNN